MGIVIIRCNEGIVSNGNSKTDQPSVDASDSRTSFFFSVGKNIEEEKKRENKVLEKYAV